MLEIQIKPIRICLIYNQESRVTQGQVPMAPNYANITRDLSSLSFILRLKEMSQPS